MEDNKDKTKEKDKGGRPEIEIDLKQLEALCGIQCTDEEIAAVLGISVKTITRKKSEKDSGFVQCYKKGKETGKASLRRIQWKAAQGITWTVWKCHKKQSHSTEYLCNKKKAKKKPECVGCKGAQQAEIIEFKGGATGMQIWLGKQWLGQKEKSAFEHTGKDGGPIEIGDLKNKSKEELMKLAGLIGDEEK